MQHFIKITLLSTLSIISSVVSASSSLHSTIEQTQQTNQLLAPTRSSKHGATLFQNFMLKINAISDLKSHTFAQSEEYLDQQAVRLTELLFRHLAILAPTFTNSDNSSSIVFAPGGSSLGAHDETAIKTIILNAVLLGVLSVEEASQKINEKSLLIQCARVVTLALEKLTLVNSLSINSAK